MSTRQDILDAVETAFAGILTASGYLTNAGQNVYVQRSTPLGASELPAICIFDSETVDADTFGEELHTLHLSLELVGSGAAADKIARQIETDVLTVVDADATWGGLADDTLLARSDELEIRTLEKIMGGLALSMDIEFTTDLYGS